MLRLKAIKIPQSFVDQHFTLSKGRNFSSSIPATSTSTTSVPSNDYPTFTIGVIGGDGIGKEVVPFAQKLLTSIPIEYSQANFKFVPLKAGLGSFKETGSAIPPETIEGLKKCNGAIVGAIDGSSEIVNPINAIRKQFNLFANVRSITSSPLINTKSGVDFVVVRENTECLYNKRERVEDGGNTAISERVITRKASTRIAELAFKLAMKRKNERSANYKKKALVTIAHKSNVMSVSDGLFRDACLEVAKKYPEVEVEEQILDGTLYRLILKPQRYDVIVTPYLYGDIVGDVGSALVGGLGIVPSIHVGDYFTVAEPVHGPATELVGKKVSNPVGILKSTSMLLQNMIGFPTGKLISDHLDEAISLSFRTNNRTPDVFGPKTTEQVGEYIINEVKNSFERLNKYK